MGMRGDRGSVGLNEPNGAVGKPGKAGHAENMEFQGTPDLLVMPEHRVNMEHPALMAMLETGVRKGSLEQQDAE